MREGYDHDVIVPHIVSCVLICVRKFYAIQHSPAQIHLKCATPLPKFISYATLLSSSANVHALTINSPQSKCFNTHIVPILTGRGRVIVSPNFNGELGGR